MHMTFWFGYQINDLLFHKLNITSITGFLVVCLCILLVVIVYESLKVCSATIKLNSALLRVPNRLRCSSDDTVLINSASSFSRRSNLWRFSEVVIYALELTLGYIIMLLVMTYNFYLLTILGLGTGLCYAFFGQKLLNLKLKTSKFKALCEHCLNHGKETSPTSSTEIIIDNVAACCSDSAPQVSLNSS